MKHDIQALRELQALPIERKILVTQTRLIEWYNHWNGQVYVSFSGGIDSTVLLDIARKLFPYVKAMFVNTGLEYPEIQQFVKSYDNVDIIRPKIAFNEVIKKYGYPVISKTVSRAVHDVRKLGNNCWFARSFDGRETKFYDFRKYENLLTAPFESGSNCCDILKKQPLLDYQKETNKMPIIGTMAEESQSRRIAWLHSGCNAFDGKHPKSQPMSFWTRQDVLEYIKLYNLPIASVYGDVVFNKNTGLYETTGVDRTGCMFCCFGITHDKEPNRFQKLKETHPKQYNYCINGGAYDENGIWQPNEHGLGLGRVLDYLGIEY